MHFLLDYIGSMSRYLSRRLVTRLGNNMTKDKVPLPQTTLLESLIVLRFRRDWTQERLATMLRVSTRCIRNWEASVRQKKTANARMPKLITQDYLREFVCENWNREKGYNANLDFPNRVY